MAKTATRFFSMIFPTTIEEEKLRIPKDFITKFGHELSSVARLHVLNVANRWKIKLVKIDEDLYLKDGLSWFLKYHSITENYLLVFNYLGKSSFEVVIFDRSANQVSFCQDLDNDIDAAAAEKSRNQDEETSLKKPKQKMLETKPNSKYGSSFLKQEKMAQTGKSGIPSLTATMKSYNVKHGCYLNVPEDFARECTKRSPVFTLQNALDGSKCHVSFTCYRKWRKSTCYKQWKISKGWPNFARINRLQEGDVCVFELMQRTGATVVQVTISRANQGMYKWCPIIL